MRTDANVDAGTAGVTLDRTAPSRRGWVHFLRHYLEMLVAMLAGMLLLGPVVGVLLDAVGLGFSHAERPGLAGLEMAFTMSVGMGAWMRVRGHGWAGILEMSAAMFVPAVALLPLLWLGAVGAGAAMALLHVAMLPLMLVAMLRRRAEYSAPHAGHRHGARTGRR